ncbi:MAG: ATP-grasp domain-containing protein [Chloroflexi bacterium]|nr:ATP-grasp domain-containing protein [Chloroflexota bacterium]
MSPSTRPPFRRLLVANRGEIAIRIFRACRDLGIETVAVHSDVDAQAPHVRAADLAVGIGPAPAPQSYLRGDRIVEVARDLGVDAIHPGYGFLSEQAAFASAVEAAGVTFVGPAPETLAGLGDKLAARRTARSVNVPILPGTFEPIELTDTDSQDRIAANAREVGFPILVKASAGGGGRGMRRVDDPADLADAVQGAAAEALQAFGSAQVYLERYAEGARHVEVQLLGDISGNVVAIGERDCSVQRRHQKLVEEAPAPGMTPEDRRRLHAMAVRIAQAVGLRNAATAEFLLSRDGELWFLEVNARLQVEHGVTELATGLDLVREQLFLAAGHDLSPAVLAAAARAAEPTRSAIELRISAEDPARAFAPTPGRLTRWQEPSGPGVRVDSGVEEGMVIPGDYDPLLAKLLVDGADRDQVLARARRALGELRTGGVQTTLPFHRWLLDQPSFIDGDLRTDMVDREWRPTELRAAAERQAAEIVLAAVNGTDAVAASVTAPSTAPPGPDGSPGDRSGWVVTSDPWVAAGRRAATERWS